MLHLLFGANDDDDNDWARASLPSSTAAGEAAPDAPTVEGRRVDAPGAGSSCRCSKVMFREAQSGPSRRFEVNRYRHLLRRAV